MTLHGSVQREKDMIDYTEKIPNNVDLGRDRGLQRALEHWQPAYMGWWYDMGPDESHNYDVYLRTAISVEPDGWAQFDYVKMPEYRWGIFLQPRDENRQVNFGMHKGQAAWQEVPGEYRSTLRRVIVTQGDTEPASVEQQRMLGASCPSMYDLRNIFQVNVEEGRHLWAMVYLLHRYFGRDGREEAESLLARRSGDTDNPRILGAFNEPTPDWLAFYMFTFFTDRDGKFQLCALAESGFDPLARTCRFMLTEEAHHMFVGETGVSRIIQRTCEVMKENQIDDPADVRALGVIDLQTIQRYLNFHYSVTLDLYGSDVSSNAANYYTSGLKGRFRETKLEDDHILRDAMYPVSEVVGGKINTKQVPELTALNERLRRLHRGNSSRRQPLAAGDRRSRNPISLDAAAQRFSSRNRKFRWTLHRLDRRNPHARAMEGSRIRVAARPQGLRVCAVADERPRCGTRKICQLDCSAGEGRKWQA